MHQVKCNKTQIIKHTSCCVPTSHEGLFVIYFYPSTLLKFCNVFLMQKAGGLQLTLFSFCVHLCSCIMA